MHILISLVPLSNVKKKEEVSIFSIFLLYLSVKRATGLLVFLYYFVLPFKNDRFLFLSEARCHLFPSNCATEANNFSRRAAKLGQCRL